MNAFLLFLHFFGLMLGAAGGLANGILMRRAATMSPEEAKTIRGLGPMLANVSAIGLALLWVTGVILVWSKYGGLGNLPSLFWVKFVFVVLLTLASGGIHMTYAQIRRTKNPALASRLAMLGPVAGISSTLAVLFAAFAFN
ncbi:MAG: hypothetical protein KDK07_13815 [Bauldia sp.]|nr:hypothetical protein [Bauldia sp.]